MRCASPPSTPPSTPKSIRCKIHYGSQQLFKWNDNNKRYLNNNKIGLYRSSGMQKVLDPIEMLPTPSVIISTIFKASTHIHTSARTFQHLFNGKRICIMIKHHYATNYNNRVTVTACIMYTTWPTNRPFRQLANIPTMAWRWMDGWMTMDNLCKIIVREINTN